MSERSTFWNIAIARVVGIKNFSTKNH
jgi:hypothetical protein